jgi:predicted deacetylase
MTLQTTPARFILRFDDISPGMDWTRFKVLEGLCAELEIKPVIGVVPDCRDKKLSIEPDRDDFWHVIRQLAGRGWTIAQHGYTHEYVTNHAGILGINRKSEFAGLSYEEQHRKLELGKEILVREQVWQPVFMAPSHSFDQGTLGALSQLGFTSITDGYGIYPYSHSGVTFVPQLFASGFNFGVGIYTVCVHLNSMSEHELAKLVRFVRENRTRFISFSDATSARPLPLFAVACRVLTELGLRLFRAVRR